MEVRGAVTSGVLDVVEVIRLAPAGESRGCAEDLEAVVFRAAGNEPFWNLEVTPDAIVLYRMGEPDLTLPAPAPQPLPGGWRYPAGESLSVTFERGDCADTMAGSRYSLRASVVTVDGELYGCAWEGREAPTP